MNRQQFYKSAQWEAFRKVIIDSRTDADGYVHCAICGRPILKPYDLIVHHKQELSEDWELIKKGHQTELTEEEHQKLYKYLIVLMGNDTLYEAIKDVI